MVETNEHTTPASGGATGSSTPKSDSELIKLMLKMLDEQRTDREEQKAAQDKQHDMLKELLVEQRKDREEQRKDREEQKKEREEQRGMMKELLDSQKKMLDSQDRMLAHITSSPRSALVGQSSRNMQFADVTTTPSKLRQPSGMLSFAKSLDSTPITIASVLSRNNAAGYGAFAEENKHAILEQPLEEILGYLGGNWADAWQFAQSGNGVFSEESVQSIIRECYDMHLAQTQNMKARSEDVHQAVLGALMSIIEARLKQEHDGDLGVEWVDTHLHPMPDGVKPDGILKLTGPHTAKDWRWVVAVFELRSDRISANQPSLVGQLVSRMVNMSKDQPRHFSMGFTGSKDGDMVFYLGLPTMVDYTKIGRLPLYRVGGNSEISAVRFLMLIYWMLPQFNGFVTSSNQGLYGELSAMLFTGIDQADASHLAGKTITVQGGKAIGGRRGQLVGPKSWIFKANLRPRDIFGPVEHILKFHWFASGYREGPIHAVVQKLGVPHVPRLVWSGIIPCQSDYKLTGEIMLVEFSGEDIKSFFESIAQTRNNWQMIDMFAGYFHALLVAATGSSTDGFILHRDISCMNLLVRDSQPFVIDWGNGIHAKDVDRVASKNNRVGTAPFMGLRAIVSASTRSLVDDIESLFLVYSFCLWSEYGEGTDDYYKMWSGTSTLNDIRGARQRWLTTEESYLAGMGLTDCPEELVALGCSLYKLLFLGTDISVYSLVKVEGDPRVTRFSTLKWVAAFKAAAGLTGKNPKSFACLNQLEVYVKNSHCFGTPVQNRKHTPSNIPRLHIPPAKAQAIERFKIGTPKTNEGSKDIQVGSDISKRNTPPGAPRRH